MSFARHPHTKNDFWVTMTEELLKNPYISEGYRKRLLAIQNEAKEIIGKHAKVQSTHYPKHIR